MKRRTFIGAIGAALAAVCGVKAGTTVEGEWCATRPFLPACPYTSGGKVYPKLWFQSVATIDRLPNGAEYERSRIAFYRTDPHNGYEHHTEITYEETKRLYDAGAGENGLGDVYA